MQCLAERQARTDRPCPPSHKTLAGAWRRGRDKSRTQQAPAPRREDRNPSVRACRMFYIGGRGVARKFVMIGLAVLFRFVQRIDVKHTLAPAVHEPIGPADTASCANRLAVGAGAVEPNRLPDGNFTLTDIAEIVLIDIADVHDRLPERSWIIFAKRSEIRQICREAVRLRNKQRAPVPPASSTNIAILASSGQARSLFNCPTPSCPAINVCIAAPFQAVRTVI